MFEYAILDAVSALVFFIIGNNKKHDDIGTIMFFFFINSCKISVCCLGNTVPRVI